MGARGPELVTVRTRIVVASVDTGLRHAEAVGRLDELRRERRAQRKERG